MSEDYNFLRSFTFNEKETKHLFQISQVRLPFLSKDNEYLKIGNADGRHFKGSNLGDLTISIDGFIIEDNSKMSVSDTIDELVKIVNSDEPKRLVLDSLDDRYFLATFNGTQEYDATNLKYTPLTLNFDVPESFARAISINGYSNIQYNVEGNLMLDSEFNNVDKFWKPFAYKIDETFIDDSVKKAWSWSADGTDRFTTKYPNENLKLGTSSEWEYYEFVGWTYDRVPQNLSLSDINLAPGDTFTSYGEYRPVDGAGVISEITWLGNDGGRLGVSAGRVINLGEEGVSVITGTVPLRATQVIVNDVVGINSSTLNKGYYKKRKFEKGLPTIYTPSPKDDFENAWPKYEGYYRSHNPVQSTNPSDYEWFPAGTPTNYSSNILQADFRTGYPVGATEPLTYLQVTPNSRRFINGIKVGDKVAISTFYRFKELGVDLSDKPNDYVVATIHLDEWGGTPLRIQNTHSVDVKKSDVVLNEFKMIGDIFKIQSKYTTHINSTVGFAGLSLFETSKPMFVYKTDKQDISEITYVKSNNTLTDNITVINNGTYKTPLLAEFTMNGESGFVGLINATNGGLLQFGDTQDVDGTKSEKTENAVHLTFDGTAPTGFEYVNTNFISSYSKMGSGEPNIFTGSFDTKLIYHSAKPVYSDESQPKNSWNGPSGVVNVPSPSSNKRSQNFGFFTRCQFDDGGKINQRGRLEVSIMDNTQNQYLNLLLRNSSAATDDIVIEGTYKGVTVWSQRLKKANLKTTRFELSIVKRDTYIRFYVLEIRTLGPSEVGTSAVDTKYNTYMYTHNITSPDTTPVYRVGVWCMRYSNSPSMEQLLLDDMQFRWYNTPTWNNVSNTFQDGDIVSINVDERKLYINGVINNQLNVVGNEWSKFNVGLGNTIIQPVVSTWANKPLVNINIQDRFI